jgi:putative ABC transport system substrate-binding protein
MRRRNFLTAACSVAATWPFAALAQRSAVPVVGFLNSGSAKEFMHLAEAFRRGLADSGYIDGKDVTIEYRWAEGQPDRLPAQATELVQRRVALIVATGGNLPALAAKAATSTIPIIFTGGGDPVKLGLVASLSRPGGNATGLANIGISLEPKRFELLRDLVPRGMSIAYLVNPRNPGAMAAVKEVQAAASTTRRRVHVVNASSEQEFEAAFAAIKERRADALLVGTDAFFMNRRERIVAFAARYGIPAIYPFREFAVAGGLMSYGADLPDQYRHVGVYAGRILKGAKPADLPVLQATKFELVINLKTAKSLGLTVPSLLAARADKLIE